MTTTEVLVEQASLPLAGKRVYSAGVIAAYTALANLPLGCVLYGLNLLARGERIRGRAMIAAGIVGGIGLAKISLFGHLTTIQSRVFLVIAILGAFCFYRFEKERVRAALRDGAVLARWWPPALILIGISIIILCIP